MLEFFIYVRNIDRFFNTTIFSGNHGVLMILNRFFATTSQSDDFH